MNTPTAVFAGTLQGLFRIPTADGSAPPEPVPVALEGPVWVHVDIADPTVVYAGSSSGIQRSVDGGATWAAADDGLDIRHVFSLGQHPTSHVLYAGTEPAAVFASDDQAQTWRPCGELADVATKRYWTFPLPPHHSHVRGFGFASDDAGTIMAAIEEGWLVRSTDGGQTWETIRAGTEFDSHAVMFVADRPDEVLATSGYGLYRSDDRGTTFARVTDGLDRRYFTPAYSHPDRPQVVFTAATAVIPPLWRRPEGADAAVYRSDDRGSSWSALAGGLPTPFPDAPIAIAGNRHDADQVFVGTAGGTVWGTSDGGAHFDVVARGLPVIRSLAVA